MSLMKKLFLHFVKSFCSFCLTKRLTVDKYKLNGGRRGRNRGRYRTFLRFNCVVVIIPPFFFFYKCGIFCESKFVHDISTTVS